MNVEETLPVLSRSTRDLVEVARLQGGRLDGHDKKLEVQRRRLEAQEKQNAAFQRRFDQFLKRFDAFLRARGRDGR